MIGLCNDPKDLSRVQSKVLFGLTKRQVICFGAAAVIGVPLFFLTKGALGTTTAALCMIRLMLPSSCSPCTRRTGSPWRCSWDTSLRINLSDQDADLPDQQPVLRPGEHAI